MTEAAYATFVHDVLTLRAANDARDCAARLERLAELLAAHTA